MSGDVFARRHPLFIIICHMRNKLAEMASLLADGDIG